LNGIENVAAPGGQNLKGSTAGNAHPFAKGAKGWGTRTRGKGWGTRHPAFSDENKCRTLASAAADFPRNSMTVQAAILP